MDFELRFLSSFFGQAVLSRLHVSRLRAGSVSHLLITAAPWIVAGGCEIYGICEISRGDSWYLQDVNIACIGLCMAAIHDFIDVRRQVAEEHQNSRHVYF